MATFTYTPDFGAQKSNSPKVRVVSFGDGYEQRLAYGINLNPEVWTLTFGNRTDSQINEIDAFLTARGGVESFDWTPYNGTAGKYVCREWSKSIDGYDRNMIQATFIQVFEP